MRARLLRMSLACVLIAPVSTGCLTSLVTDRWSGRDRVSEIGFRLGGPSVVQWIVRSGGREREGRFEISGDHHDCDPLSFFVYDQKRRVTPLDPDEWAWAKFALGGIDRYLDEERAGQACDALIFVDTVGRYRDPRLSLMLDTRPFARLEVQPPRRHGMLAAYPFTAIVDMVGVVTGGVFLLYAFSERPPTWHTWTKSHGIEYHRLPEDETVGQSPDREVYP